MPDLDAMFRSLAELQREHAKRARAARKELKALLATPSEDRPRSKHARMLLLLEPWQLRAVQLLADISGGTVQEKIRSWVTAGILVESRGRK